MTKFAPIPKDVYRKLRKAQADAVDFAISHLNSLDSSSLIRMPTGTGKTGVIACLSMISNPGSSLVLTPWAPLRTQMVDDVRERFWQKLGLAPPTVKVESLFPSSAERILKSHDRKVLIATFATLNELRLNYDSSYTKLAASVSLVIVDEGHYEPAVEWGRSVKGLRAKTILLTATPYRNDLKLFRITDPSRSTHHFTHKQAVETGIIRRLEFRKLAAKADIPSLSAEFAEQWNALKKAKTLPSPTPRAIVCCATDVDIAEAVTHLRKAGIEAIGVHEQFKHTKNPHLQKDVPDLQKTGAEVWVHQNKLTEGIDDHRFCVAALFTRIRNDRKLIQQIGRILRRESTDRKSAALVLAPEEFSPKAEWDAYLDFETKLNLLDPQHFRDVVNTLLGAQPEVEYFDGRFRRRFQPGALEARPQVVIPPSVLVRSLEKGFSLDGYVEDCTDTLNTEDAVILGPSVNTPCQKGSNFALWVYASVRNSRFLDDVSLYEIRLETHCAVVAGGFLFMTDSAGHFPVEYLEEHTGFVPPEKLTRFLDKTFRVTNVSTDSSIPYDTVIRGAELRGHNLLSVPASLTDRVQICRAARGTSTKHGRRYVGAVRGRLRKEVSEVDRRTFDLTNFVSWAEGVAHILNSQVSSSDLFRRYMPTCAPPANPVPQTISLDFDRLDLGLVLEDGTQCTLKSSSSTIQTATTKNQVTYTCSFAVEGSSVTGGLISLNLEYNQAKRCFWFTKGDGPSVRVSFEGDQNSSKSLMEFLNQRQDIVLIGLRGGEIVYQGRQFYRIDYSYAEEVLLGLIHQPSHVPTCSSEKGTKAQIAAAQSSRAITFPDRSVFRAIANQQLDLPFRDELLICDDLGSECADFVAANFRDAQLALIHAKNGGGAKISASAFHEVAAQAMKNLVYLTRNSEIPKGIGSWRRDGKWNSTGVPRMYRVPAGMPSGKTLWEKIKSDIVGTSNPGLYVVLATTGCCDLQALKAAVKDRDKRTPEVAQLLYLLDGLNGYARQLGARLLVVDIPYRA